MTFGGNEINDITFSATKKIKILVTHNKRLREVTEDDITFTEEDADSLLLPHNDTLVTSLNVSDFKIKHVLDDPRSSAKIIQWRVLEQAKLTGSIIPTTKLLVRFNLASVTTRGEILLPTNTERYPLRGHRSQAKPGSKLPTGKVKETSTSRGQKQTLPLPNIDQMIDATAGHELISFLDSYSGYNQIKMNLKDREKTSFIMNFGTYCYNMMPFGLKNAEATYQRLVNKMFENQIGKIMEAYIDDMLVKSLNVEDHLKHLQENFDILRKCTMKLDSKKCAFGVGSEKFLGFLVSQREIEVNPDKIKAIEDIPDQLTNVKEVQRLTGG
ncbi:PREDICTED: uncharacterized protein LOC109224221 [Nicotiana attenuata]|uniref:uncharacterized protein LOC109224221 n=1 Tax=Nicotiana attenuata TaxID=49451 RepID=UPI000904F14B|nr:PREDICTED: uncharacterized protein LOC109224221 [Nicotiana attenuata]